MTMTDDNFKLCLRKSSLPQPHSPVKMAHFDLAVWLRCTAFADHTNMPGDVPKTLKLAKRLCCREAHPGLCRDRDATVFPNAFLMGNFLCKRASSKKLEGMWLAIFAVDAVGTKLSVMHLFTAFVRHSNPVMAIFCAADLVHNNLVTLRIAGSLPVLLTAWAVARHIFVECGKLVNSITAKTLHAVPISFTGNSYHRRVL